MKKLLLFLFLLGILNSCNTGVSENNKESNDSIQKIALKHPDWIKDKNIYEVNIRQYTKEGTIKEFQKHLPRLKEMGVDILWLMPINPIGKKNRKGTLGSYYSVKDYYAVNEDFGTMQDFKNLVSEAHKLKMYVIIDWVANHTAWDNPWVTEHPEYYTKDSLGNFIPPIGTDWSDVLDLNYDNDSLRKEMINALSFWVKQADIDGYRCDVASWLPIDFWNRARKELDEIKPVFMLAESEDKNIFYQAFDMGYAWNLHHIMNEISKGNNNAKDISNYFVKDSIEFPENSIKMNFTSNHDENSWNGTVFERMPESYKTFAVLSATVPGMPLIYSGQEVSLNKRLEFFEKDQIDWNSENNLSEFYKTLLNFKKGHSALWNGNFGGSMKLIKTNNPEKVFAFIREKNNDIVLIISNLSKEDLIVDLDSTLSENNFKELFSDKKFQTKELKLSAWEYNIFYIQK
ncbi:MAG: alpha-glucosidase C-terminal domain-containing protein [Bacteroidales bacterium]|nr:alpha-glucosidase C-terminal domain-containing protein [Bacteroidales bacterium]